MPPSRGERIQVREFNMTGNSRKTHGVALVFLPVLLLCVSCMPGIRLDTQGAPDSEVTGTYTVILYGCNFLDDLETIAFLDREGDQYTFEPFAPDFKFRIKKGVPAKEALAEAKNFLNCNTSFSHAQLSRIITPDGAILGYEVRPLYKPFRYGLVDVLYTDYRIKGDRVVLKIKLDPSIENMLQGSGGSDRDR